MQKSQGIPSVTSNVRDCLSELGNNPKARARAGTHTEGGRLLKGSVRNKKMGDGSHSDGKERRRAEREDGKREEWGKECRSEGIKSKHDGLFLFSVFFLKDFSLQSR